MYRILLVDDEPIVKVAFRKLLGDTSERFVISATASNGEEALAWLRENPADILVTDLKMPQTDGIELIRRLGETPFDGCVLVLSNYTDFELVHDAMVAGAIDYMLKVQLDQPTLLQQLEKAAAQLDKKQLSRRKLEASDTLLRQSTALLRQSTLREYFADAAGASPAPDLPAEPSGWWLYDIHYWPHTAQAQKNTAESMVSVLQALFEGAAALDALPLRTGEILCLVAEPPSGGKSMRPADFALHIRRQFQLYFGLTACTLAAGPAPDLPAAHAQFQLCRVAADCFFYPTRPELLYACDVTFSDLPPEWGVDSTVEKLTERFFLQGAEGVEALLDTLITACDAQRVRPRELCGLLFRATQKIARALDREGDDTLSATAELLACKSARQLKDATAALLPRLLEDALPPSFHKAKKEVRDALLFVRFHYTERISLEDVAGMVGLNASYLCRLFKKETGKSLFNHINALRMERAASLLAKGTLYVKDVSAQVGLDDPFYFTRLFTKYYGVPPKEFGGRKG